LGERGRRSFFFFKEFQFYNNLQGGSFMNRAKLVLLTATIVLAMAFTQSFAQKDGSPDQFVSYVLTTDTASMTAFLARQVNTPNSQGNTALSVAVNKKNFVMVKYLLEHDANINIKSNQLGLTPLEDAATRAATRIDEDIFNMLIKAHKRKDPKLQNIGSAMHLAARYGSLKNMQILVEEGANPAAKSMEGLTPLHEAAKEGRKSVVEYLISKKVEINPLDRDGYTPYDWAEAMGAGSTFPEVAKILQKAGGKHTAAWRAAM
jgi:ankyrin repeat protein